MSDSKNPNDGRNIQITGQGIIYNEGASQGTQIGNVSFGESRSSSLQDILALVEEIQSKFDSTTGIDPSTLNRINEDLMSAKNAVNSPEPDVKRALNRMQSVAALLKNIATITASTTTLLPLINKCIIWLTSLVNSAR